MDKVNNKIGALGIFTILFSLIWSGFVLIDYFNKHPIYGLSIKYFKLWNLLIGGGILIGLLTWHLTEKKLLKRKIPINGITITLLSFISAFMAVYSYKNFSNYATGFWDIMKLLRWNFTVILIGLLLIMVLKSIGQVLYRKFLKESIKPNYLLEIALGLMVFIFCLFILGIFKLLTPNAIIALLFIFSLVNIFDLGQSLKALFVQRISISHLNALGVFSFILILFYLNINFISSQGPFPSGFDSRNYYVNISKLIADNQGLIEGFQPYNWSLFMSVGFILFDYVEMALGFSFLGIILTCFASYKLAVEKIGFNPNFSLFAIALFVFTPAITNQLYIELKVDFAMLFFQMLILYYLFELLKKINQQVNLKPTEVLKSNFHLILIIGVLSGFALGIKMINAFMVISVITLIWWNAKNKVAVLGILAFSLFLFLAAGIDDISGLSRYHLSANIIKWVLLLVSLVAVVYSILKFKNESLAKIYITAGYLFFAGLLVSPWIVKNYSESKSLSPQILLMGKNPGPEISLGSMHRAYKRSLDKQNKKEN